MSDAHPYPLSAQQRQALEQRLLYHLDIRALFDLFVTELKKHLPHQGFSYQNPAFDIDFSLGFTSLHAATFDMHTDTIEVPLGQCTLARTTPFGEDEKKWIADMLCILYRPLYNALKYYAVLKNAHQDPLTRFGNRASFEATILKEIKYAKQFRTPLSLLFIDVDDFKKINDTHGHITGDAVLVHISGIIKQASRLTDLLYRYGGEEFVVLLPRSHARGAKEYSKRICHAVAHTPYQDQQQCIEISVSIGVSAFTPHDTPESLLKRADAALYEAKSCGKNRTLLR